jgi:hypothetical protein
VFGIWSLRAWQLFDRVMKGLDRIFRWVPPGPPT